MLQTLLVLASIALLMLTLWAVKGFARANTLRLLAALMRRELPLESSLAALGDCNSRLPGERLAGNIALNLDRGDDLPMALRRLKILNPQQAAALELAQEHEAAPAMLSSLALHATRTERQLAENGLMMLYPLVLGFVIFVNTQFITIFVMPKFGQMAREMEIVAVIEAPFLAQILAASLVLWGLFACSIQVAWLGRAVWWRVPVIGVHLRMAAQAALARNLGLMLSAGATLENALNQLAEVRPGGPMKGWLAAIQRALQRGETPLKAFRAHGQWRPEFLWALDAVTGSPPAATFGQVAEVLDDKAEVRLGAIHRVLTPVAILSSAAGVGLIAWTVFAQIESIQRALLP